MEKIYDMVELNKEFQKELFIKVIKKYKGSIKASRILKIPASSIRGYKNLYFNSVPLLVIQNIIDIGMTNNKEVKINTILNYIKEEKVKNIMLKGRRKINFRIARLKKNIPSLKEIKQEDYLNVSKWFEKYRYLVDTPFRKINVLEKGDFILIMYSNYTKFGYKYFKVSIPKKIYLDSEFFYFFGLWCGDRTGGKRFGIANKNEKIINFTEYFLKKYNQPVEKILLITKGLKFPKIEYNKSFEIENKNKGWVLSVHTNNGIFATFFHYLQSQMENLFNSDLEKYAFLAGLFDAEGNVSLYNKSLRWACKNQKLIKIYTKLMKDIGVFHRYDGGCLISYNLKILYSKMFPFLKHSEKVNLFNFLFKGEGTMPKEYLDILRLVTNFPNKSAIEISKALKKNKVYSELKMLRNFKYIRAREHPNKYEVTSQGRELLGRLKL